MMCCGPGDLDFARPYGSPEHPFLRLQSVVEAYVQGKLRFGRTAEQFEAFEGEEQTGDSDVGDHANQGARVQSNEMGRGMEQRDGFGQVENTSKKRRNHFDDEDETFVEVVMDNQVSKVAAAEILLAIPQYIILMTVRWQERVTGGELDGETAAGRGLDCDDGGFSRDSRGSPRQGQPMIPLLTSTEYILHAIRLFVSLSPVFRVMQTSLTLFDREFERILVDALTMVFLSVSSEFGMRRLVEALGETEDRTDGLLARDAAAMLEAVPAAIHALFVFLTETSRGIMNNGKARDEWIVRFEEEIEAELVHERLELVERGWMFLPAAIEATRALGQVLLFRLRKENELCFLNAGLLAQRLEFSVMLLEQVLVCQGAFTWFSEREGHVTALGRLVCTVFELVTHKRATAPYICIANPNDPDGEPFREARVRPTDARAGDWFYDTDQCRGYAGYAVSQICALMVSLAFHNPSFSDLLVDGGKEAEMVVEVMIGAFMTLGKQLLLRPSVMKYEICPGESQLHINFMRLSEIVSDDSNFKERLHVEMIDVLQQVICHDRSTFRSMWGPMGAQAVLMMCKDKHTVNSKSTELRLNAESCKKAVRAFMGEIRRKTNAPEENQALDRLTHGDLEMGVSLALERVVLLIKLIGNLQMHHEEGGPNTFGGLLGEAIKETTAADPPAMLDAKDNIEYLLKLGYEFRGKGRIKLVVPLLEHDELRYFEIFKESAEEILTVNVQELGCV